MKNLLSLFFFSIFILFSCQKETEHDDLNDELKEPAAKVVTTETIESEILSREMHYSVYLPAGYNDSNEEYPVLYLLHGMWGNYKDWVDNGMSGIVSTKIMNKEIVKMIVIMPDGLDAFYCNNYAGGNMRYEDFMIEEFIPQIEERYRIKSDGKNRAIAGLSMGGYGATFHAFKRPGMFCYCYAMSGAFEVGGAPELKAILNGYSETERKSLPTFSMECGKDDALVFSSNESFDKFLTEKGIEHEYIKRPGAHDWVFWTECLPKVLTAVSSAFE